VRKIKPDLGLAHDNPRLDAREWSQAIKYLLATEKPSVIIVMLGVSDRWPLCDRVSAAIGTPTLGHEVYPLVGFKDLLIEPTLAPEGAPCAR